jgi:predicted Zn-dependent protease
MGAIFNYFFPVNPVTERREFHLIPSSIENFVGQNSYAPLIAKSGGEITEAHATYGRYVALVKKVGAALAQEAKRKDLVFEFTVIDSQEDNAWCLPGGKIGINLGLIQNMEKEGILGTNKRGFTLDEKIAAVLSHEIVHADARHTGRSLEFRLFLVGIIKAAQMFVVHLWVDRSYNAKIKEADPSQVPALTAERKTQAERIGTLFNYASSWLISGISLCNSRSHELESDRYGMRMLQDTGVFPPEAAVWLQHYFNKHHSQDTGNTLLNRIINYFSSHPSPKERLEANKQTLKDLQEAGL